MKPVTLVFFALITSQAAIAQGQTCARAEHVFVRPSATPDTRPVSFNGATIQVDRVPIATSADLTEVSTDANDKGTVRMKFTPAAAKRLTRATTNNSGARLAFLVDDEVLLLVTWEGEFGFTSSGVQLSFARESDGERVVKALQPCVAPSSKAAQ